MNGYLRVLLKEMVGAIGEERVKPILSGFSCRQLNGDVEDFIKHKAIEFAKQGIASTTLVFTPYRGEPVLVGYFSLANKCIDIPTRKLSSSLRKRISRFSIPNGTGQLLQLALPLIAQLGKNYANGYDALMSGDELLKMAIDQVKEGQRIFGGKCVYLECEDNDSLREFYERNGFCKFSERQLDGEDIMLMRGKKLIQMIRYINN